MAKTRNKTPKRPSRPPPPLPAKTVWRPGNLVVPAPAALVSCGLPDAEPNLITIAWCGNVNSEPPMLGVSLRPIRHSYGIIAASGEFVLNIPSTAQARAVDYCGVVSGRDVNKWRATGLTPAPAGGVACPAVAECPISISCRVEDKRELGSHVLFLARILEVAVQARLMDENGRFAIERANLLCYAHGFYFSLGRRTGAFGWSVRKRTPKNAGIAER